MHDAIIIGAGLAGCGLAIQLAQQGQRVLLLEQQRYPTHKLCGEFLSTEVTAIFERLGILEAVQAAGAVPIRRASLTTCTGESFRTHLPGTALGLSRYALDRILWQRALEVGATCLDRTPVTAIDGNLAEGFTVSTAAGFHRARLAFGAYGKCSRLDRQRGRRFAARPNPFVAVKGHYTGLSLAETVELHAFPGGYCGLSEIEAGVINVCWIGHGGLMRSAAAGLPPTEPFSRAVLRRNSSLASRLEAMTPVAGASQALGQISFALKGTFDDDLWMIGDTAGMIAPLCGDGMAMALGSADLALPIALAFLGGHIEPKLVKGRYRQGWNRAFRRRLQLGRCLQQGLLHPAVARLAVGLCGSRPALGDALIRATRGAERAR
ncbi:FAD-dependent monooxygenase [Synechococcus sp. Tobar12-5m-g]|uniref:NAD(P)/FAD-dependent oxidoreductase n=1 Tax=unclassified Synechococcus TaxID=2626047 RepID=UPI0020CD9268|nr:MULTISPECIES: FAD-dependent oxidoreductase [unclassified Synechococcus]MCP9771167.1 FAD-dependent monooxygenase [Synechococcus sp. Tobar12-5m-g]MCP9872107.1 FAD-dependent monooxygenase [Synechococcus sp. Cruz CV-v-12]